MVSVDQLPRDANGAVCGLWRMYHRDSDYTGQIGMCTFVNGVSQAPLFGVPLQTLVAVIGGDLYMTPWEGPVPGGAPLPEVLTYEIPADALTALDPLPDAYGVQAEKAPERAAEAQEPPVSRDVEVKIAGVPIVPRQMASFSTDHGDDLDRMNRAEVFALAQELGLKPHHRAGVMRLRRMIRDDRSRD